MVVLFQLYSADLLSRHAPCPLVETCLALWLRQCYSVDQVLPLHEVLPMACRAPGLCLLFGAVALLVIVSLGKQPTSVYTLERMSLSGQAVCKCA